MKNRDLKIMTHNELRIRLEDAQYALRRVVDVLDNEATRRPAERWITNLRDSTQPSIDAIED